MESSKNVHSCRFFSKHNSCVRSVAFNPKDRYLFCSGGNDGQIGIYHAGRAEALSTNPNVISTGVNRYVSAVCFSSDGKKILATTSLRRVSVIDVEHGTPIVCYDNCVYSHTRDRTPLAVDPECPNIAACSYVNGKGVTILDLRMPLPLDFIFDFHSDTIRDITFLHESWPFSKSSSLLESNVGLHHKGYSLLSLSSQGIAKVTSIDGRLLHTFDFGHPGNSIVPTPEHYGATHDGFTSAWICGGYNISSYVPNEETFKQQLNGNLSISDLQEHSLSIPSQIHFNPAYNFNMGGGNNGNNRYSGDGGHQNHEINRNSSPSSNSNQWNPGFNVIISNPNNVNLNVYQIPRRNELIFGNIGSIDSIRISRAIRSLVASSHQQVNNQPLQSSSSGAANSIVENDSGASSSSSSNNRLLRNVIQQLPYQQIVLDGEPNQNLANNNNGPNFINDCNDDEDNEDYNINQQTIDNCNQQSNQKIDINTPVNSFVKKTLFYHDHWDSTNSDHPQQIWRLRFSSNGAHLYAAGEGGFVRSYRRYPNLTMHCLGEVYRHRGDILDMDISPYDEFTASKDKTVGCICLGSPSHGWTEYYEYT